MTTLDRKVPQPSFLPIVAGVLALATGWLALALPQVLATPAYPAALRKLAQTQILYTSGGIFILVAYAVKSRRNGWLPVTLALIGTLPYFLTAIVAGRLGIWISTILGATLGVGVLADMVRPMEAPPDASRRIPTLAVALVVLTLGIGLVAIMSPAGFALPATSLLRAHLRHLGIGLFAAGALLVLGWIVPRAHAATQIAASVPLFAMAVAFIPTGRWLAVFTYGFLGLTLAAETRVHRLLCRRACDRLEQPHSVSQFELATEAVAWGVVLLTALLSSTAPYPGHRANLSILMVLASLFTTVWYHLIPVRGGGIGQTILASAVYSVLAAALMQTTGGSRSPYFFVSFLPILPLAWTHVPESIAVPTAIPMAALLAEITVTVLGGWPNLPAMLMPAVPRMAGLLMVSGFAYLLATRNLSDQSRIREAHRQLETVLTHMGEGLIAVGQDGHMTLCNPAAATLLGQSPDALRGQSLTEVLSLRREDGTPVGQSAHPMWRALSGHRVPWARYKIGGQTPIAAAVAATPVAGGSRGHGAIILVRDVHAEVEVERMREDFFFIASHELRTPLTVMKGNLEIALEGSPPPALRATLQEALGSTQRLIRMVNDFLDAARLDHGSVSMHTEDGSLTDLVQQAVRTLQPDAERKGLTVIYNPPADLPLVRMDAERTLQILLNLLGNSLRYTQAGQIEIWHTVDGREVETLVKDTGIGIPEEHHGRLFARFAQVERGLRRGGGGSGLGLYISRRLAEQMGGTVILKASAPGQGSTFALRLPAVASPVPVR